MAKNFCKSGDVVTLTAPSGGVVSGMLYVIGALPVIALTSAAQGAPFEGKTTGEWTLPKVGSQGWAEGVKVNWDATNSRCSTTGTTGFFPIGVATAVVGSGANDTSGTVRLNGVATTAL
jgi:predicted RecA/RadA family phage recombinase